MTFILASGSPRRQELLKRVGINFTTVPSSFDESLVSYEGNPSEYVMTLARMKAQSAFIEDSEETVILGADTVVSIDGKILGKPLDRKDAYAMMEALQGGIHDVYSGMALYSKSLELLDVRAVRTRVKFSPMTHEEIHWYLDRDEWQDKAGAYGIQGSAALFIEGIEGDYYNVMGLPLHTLFEMLKRHSLIM